MRRRQNQNRTLDSWRDGTIAAKGTRKRRGKPLKPFSLAKPNDTVLPNATRPSWVRMDSAEVSFATLASTDVFGVSHSRTDEEIVESHELVPKQLFGNYRIESELGEGGMGKVYLATQQFLNRKVAIKILPGRLVKDSERIVRFEREMLTLGHLRHPNIVAANDAGSVDGIRYIAMEYVDGVDLDRMVHRIGTCEPKAAAQLIAQIAIGLQFAHENGVVHRDIKPANIMVTRDGSVKIADLGLAKLRIDDSESSSNLRLTGEMKTMGTPDYMAPEQWEEAANANGKADLYSLGCTLYFLLVGQPPFGGIGEKSHTAKMKAHLFEPAPEITNKRSDVPEAMNRLYRSLMEKKPELRPASAEAVVQELRTIYPELSGPLAVETSLDIAEIERLIEQKKSKPKFRNERFLGVLKFKSMLTRVLIATACVIGGYTYLRSNVSIPSAAEMSVAPAISVFVTKENEDIKSLVGRDTFFTEFGSRVELFVTLPRPQYCYVIGLNPTNNQEDAVQLVYPSKEDVAPSKLESVRLPELQTGWYALADGTGQQGYVVIASEEPLPAFNSWFAENSSALKWKKTFEPGVWRYVDGDLLRVRREETAMTDESGSLNSTEGKKRDKIRGVIKPVLNEEPQELTSVLKTLNERFSGSGRSIAAFAFPVVEAEHE